MSVAQLFSVACKTRLRCCWRHRANWSGWSQADWRWSSDQISAPRRSSAPVRLCSLLDDDEPRSSVSSYRGQSCFRARVSDSISNWCYLWLFVRQGGLVLCHVLKGSGLVEVIIIFGGPVTLHWQVHSKCALCRLVRVKALRYLHFTSGSSKGNTRIMAKEWIFSFSWLSYAMVLLISSATTSSVIMRNRWQKSFVGWGPQLPVGRINTALLL